MDPRWLFSGRKVLTVVVAIRRNATAFEYLEEYPVGILAELETQTGRKAPAGLFVVIMEYGRNFSGDDKDVFCFIHGFRYTSEYWGLEKGQGLGFSAPFQGTIHSLVLEKDDPSSCAGRKNNKT